MDNFGDTPSQHASYMRDNWANHVWDMKLDLPGESLSVGMVYFQVRYIDDINGIWTIGTSFTSTNVPAGVQCHDIQLTNEDVNGHSGFYWLKCDFGGQVLVVPSSGTVYSKIQVTSGSNSRMDTGSSTHTSFYYQNGNSRDGYASFYFEAIRIGNLMLHRNTTIIFKIVTL